MIYRPGKKIFYIERTSNSILLRESMLSATAHWIGKLKKDDVVTVHRISAAEQISTESIFNYIDITLLTEFF